MEFETGRESNAGIQFDACGVFIYPLMKNFASKILPIEYKTSCQANPSWACAYAPKMEEFCKTLFFRRSSSERRTRRFPKAAAFGVFSFAISLRRGKEMASLRHSERAKQCEPVEEVVKNLIPHHKIPLPLLQNQKISAIIYNEKICIGVHRHEKIKQRINIYGKLQRENEPHPQLFHHRPH